MQKALIYVIDTSKREEYSTLKNFALRAGFDAKTAVGAIDVNVNYDVELMQRSPEEAASLASEFDMLALIGGYKAYYLAVKKKPPLKSWDLNIDTGKLNALIRAFSDSGKLVVAPFAMPAYLARLGLLKGRSATVYPTTELILLLREGGANFMNRQIVRDGNIITIKDLTLLSEKDFMAVFREAAREL
jgi:putative intracellular protease/amidase